MIENLYGRTAIDYEKLGASHTAREIAQQPHLWQTTFQQLVQSKKSIDAFLASHRKTHTKIILTGAGTSEFVANTAVPYLKKCGVKNVFSISSTDIVASPENYISSDDDILLLSFARSGNSPESVAAVKLVDQIAHSSAHLMITCNHDGQLAQYASQQSNAYAFVIEGANDQGFAMTGSFTSMLMSAIFLFTASTTLVLDKSFNEWVQTIESFWLETVPFVNQLVLLEKKRLICLGSGFLKGIAQEAHLKVLELASSHNTVSFDSSMGFRHGPKSVLNDESLVIVFVNPDPYTQKYDLDILKELMNTAGNHFVVAISPIELGKEFAHINILLPKVQEELHFLYALTGISFMQRYSLENSIALGIAPDNPSPSGSVNRVVEGVTIYPYTNSAG